MHTAVSKTVTFDAAHSLSHHEGKCRELHGHTYRLTVTVSGHVRPVVAGDVRAPVVITERPQPTYDDADTSIATDERPLMSRLFRSDVGMVYDFGDLTAAMRSLADQLDHQYINRVLPDVYPTAENLCLWFYQGLRSIIPDEIEVSSVVVAETPNSAAELTAEMYARR